MMNFITKNKVLSWLRGLLVFGVWTSIWQIISLIVGQEILLPPPGKVFLHAAFLLRLPEFWYTIFSSFFRIMGGFFLGVMCGCLLAVGTCVSPWMKRFFTPALKVIKATPVASFIILALVWMKQGGVSIFIVFLMVLPLIWANVSAGIESADPKLLQMAKLFGFSRSKILRLIYWPTVFPFLLSGIITALGFAWKAGVAAEVLATPQNSIGTQLYDAKIYLETTDLFAWTVVVILLSMAIEAIVVRLLHRGIRKKGGLLHEGGRIK
jgi:NitT/TauT family transport system permease protein